jgi:hypothetical protein
MRSRRWFASGIIAACIFAPFAPACGNDTFTSSTADASLSDTTTISEAASNDASADGPYFCQLGPATNGRFILCADFDESDLRTAYSSDTSSTLLFTTAAATDGGQLYRSSTGYSPPSSLESSISAVADASIATETIVAPSDQPGATYFGIQTYLRFNNVGDLDGPGTIALLSFALSDGTTTKIYQLVVTGQHVLLAVFDDKTFAGSINLGGVPGPTDGWQRFHADIQIGGEGMASASFNGASGTTPSLATTGHTQAGLYLGASTVGGTGSLDVSYDNLLIFADQSFDAGIADAGHD